MSDHALVSSAIARLVGGDPLAVVILEAAADAHPDSFSAHAALALVSDRSDAMLRRAAGLAASRRDRQHLAVCERWLRDVDDHQRALLLAREHLAEFPEDIIISWLTSRR